ncbi:MAG: HD domain-containing protein [Candidatus Xenobiia bacterium LiM19]
MERQTTPVEHPPKAIKNGEDLPEILLKIKKSSFYSDTQMSLIVKAYLFSKSYYSDTQHKSGVPLVRHCLEIVKKLWEIKSDAHLIATAFLHDILKHTDVWKQNLIEEFGEDIAELVEGTQMFHVSETHRQKYAENLEKLLAELSRDPRIVIIRLVHRLDDLENYEWRKREERKLLIEETREIYIPLADKLGMRSISSKLEDLCFKHTNRDVYEIIEKKLEQTRKEDETYLELVSTAIKKLLWEIQIHATVTGRIKNIYGLYRKMVRQKKPLEKLLDKVAVRIIVDDVATCYKVLGMLHTHFVHIPGTFDDYISLPKANNYRSLHTCIYPFHGIAQKPVEIQIRTPLMHEVAEYGIAAHWKYKEEMPHPQNEQEHLRWIKSLVGQKKEYKTPKSFYTDLKRGITEQYMFVFDEKAKVTYLPKDSTPLDFARHRGMNIDQKRDKVKINGKLSKWNNKIFHGDIIEIVRDETQPL